jgi:hypothetical protein
LFITYEELNDFLPAARRRVDFDYAFEGTPAVVDLIEAIGVLHTEVDLILVDGVSVGIGLEAASGWRSIQFLNCYFAVEPLAT